MVIKNLDAKTPAQKLLYSFHLAGLGFFLKWISYYGPIYFFVVIPILIFVQYHYNKNPIDGDANIWRDILLIVLVFGYGVGSLWNFVGHFFMTETVAASIGWESSPFQIELAGYHLAFAMLGILSLWNRNVGYWGAVVHGMAIFLLSAAYIHIYEMIEYQNYSYGNASMPILVGTTIYPIAVILIFWKYHSQLSKYKKVDA